MRTLVMTALVAAGLVGSPLQARAQARGWEEDAAGAPRPVDPKKAADIRILLELTGAAAIAKQTVAQMVPSLRTLAPDAPDSFWTEFIDEMKGTELIERIIPVYDRHLSHADVKALIAFYRTPAGKRLIQAMPLITSESMKAGQAWGAEIGRRVMERIQERQEAAAAKALDEEAEADPAPGDEEDESPSDE